MIVESELREKIRQALRGDLPLEDLYDWLMSRNWNTYRTSEPDAVALAEAVARVFWNPDIGADSENLRRALGQLSAGR